jgi:hypothetical protein
MRSCSVCRHEATASIAKELARDVPLRSIVSHYQGLTLGSLHRHASRCLRIKRSGQPQKPAPESSGGTIVGLSRSIKNAPGLDPKALLRRAEHLLDDAQAILSRAAGAGDDRMALTAVRETRASLELVMRAHGMLANDGPTVNIDARKQSLALFAGLSTDEIRAKLADLSAPAVATTGNRAFPALPAVADLRKESAPTLKLPAPEE